MIPKFILTATFTLLTQAAFAQGIQVHNAYARETVSGMKQSGAFLTLKNTDTKDNRLISAHVGKKIASYTELHTHINNNGVMRMRPVQGGIPLPAGETVELKPGSYHIMFFGLKQNLTAGQTIPITLKFQDGQRKRVVATVKSWHKPPTQPAEHHHHHH